MLDSRPLTALTILPRIFSFLRAICLSYTLTASCPERNQDIGSKSCTTIVNLIMKKYILALFVYSRIIRGLGVEFHYSSAVQFEFPGSRLAKCQETAANYIHTSRAGRIFLSKWPFLRAANSSLFGIADACVLGRPRICRLPLIMPGLTICPHYPSATVREFLSSIIVLKRVAISNCQVYNVDISRMTRLLHGSTSLRYKT